MTCAASTSLGREARIDSLPSSRAVRITGGVFASIARERARLARAGENKRRALG